ncbi:hypothetical protein Pcinc_007296 [Petrolisthes cinctipes]|uniref:Ion transport domain-containing protein n=1 Tax=Petrolisthes cinctipes TaxID=88211 RepID=A0AAE1KYB6_PETCI|nr:hypothetical protein Pcinc_007296 [Petrolisthes cinctipes]
MRHFSIKNERRPSSNVHLESVFTAIQNQSLELLRVSLGLVEGCINGHSGPFYITPLHSVVEQGWVEGVRDLLQHGASVCARNQYDQTPLHYAAASKQKDITELLLDNSSSISAINLHDMRGMSPLHEGAASGYLPVVKLLLASGALPKTVDKQGESPLHKAAKAGAFDVMVALMEKGADLHEKDFRGISAMRWLQLTTSNGLQKLFDHLFIVSSVGNQMSPITFNFSALANTESTQQCQLLSFFVETNNAGILAHPVCHIFLLIKWKRARLVFLGYLLYFVTHAIFIGIFIFFRQLYSKCRDQSKHTPMSQNITTENITTSCAHSQSEQTCHLWMEVCLCVMTFLSLVTQLNRLRIKGLAYIKVPSFWLHMSSVGCVMSLLISSWYHGPWEVAIWEHHVATVVLLLLQIQFLLILKKYPSHGLYVAMFIRVTEDFLRIFFVYCTLLLCFTVTLYLVFNTGKQEDPVYSRWPLLFLKSVTMMLGSVDINKNFVSQLDQLPYTSYLTIFLFTLLISIVLSNLLVALAVSDINDLRSSAHLTRLASMVEAITTMEQLCDLPLLWRLADFCKLDTQATHVRLWPQHDVRHPSIIIEERKLNLASPVWPRWYTWLRARLHPGRYQVHIPSTLQQDILLRISSRDSVVVSHQTQAEPHLSQQLYDELIKRLTTLENLLSKKKT